MAQFAAQTISRSPVVHPGDIQRVYAIGKPPADQLCLFSHLRNVVVLPSMPEVNTLHKKNVSPNRSLASRLGGGDLDGSDLMLS